MGPKSGNRRKGTSATADLSAGNRVPAGILFGDMKGSTAAAEKDELATVKVLREYLKLIDITVHRYSPRCYKVKAESDGFMARFANAHAMVECGMALQHAFQERQWKVRLGGNYVEAFEDTDGGLLGADMNRTARIASAADAESCQFLVAPSVPPVVRDRLSGISFKDYGSIEAKGVDGGLLTYEVVTAGSETLLEKRRSAYLDAVARAHEWIDLGGLAPQVGTELLRVGLDDVFVHLSAVRSVPEIDRFRREEIRLRGEVDESALVPRERDRRLRDLVNRLDQRYLKEDSAREERVDLVALTEQRLNVVVGDPGSGKTTLLRYLARRVALRRALDGSDAPLSGPWVGLTPVYVRVGEFASHLAQEGASLDEFIPRGAGLHAVPIPQQLFEFDRRSGRCLFFFDGLDEIVETRLRQHVRDAVRDFAIAHPQCPVVFTSRIVGYRDAPLPPGESGFAHFTLSAFGDPEITRFLERWYQAIARTGQLTDPARQNARTLAEGISRNPSVRRLATNPLLLTLIALIYWREVKLPRRRIELYRAAATTLLEKWRQIGVDVRESASILMTVAFEMHSTSGVGLITRPELERILVALKMDPKRGGRSEIDAERETQAFLKLIGEQSGILYPRGLDDRGFEVFGFLHLTFEEYFAAREFARRWKQGQFQLCDYLHLPRWREILLLASAHLSDEDDDEASSRFVRQILDANSPYETQLHRDLLLAAHCLADDAVVYPDVRRDALNRLDAAFNTTIIPLNELISAALVATAGSRMAADALALATERLSHRHRWVRFAAASAFGALSQAGATPQALGALLPLLRDTNPNVRSAAASAVGALGPAGVTPQVLDAFFQLLRDTNPEVRSTAASAVGALGPAGATPQGLDALLPLLRDKSPNVRSAAVRAIGALGQSGATPQGLDALLPLLHDTDPNLRSTAARAVGALGPACATPLVLDALLVLLCDTSPNVRSAAARAVGDLGPAGATPQGLDALLPLLRDTSPNVRSIAARVVGALGPAGATPMLDALLPLLRDTDPSVRTAAASAVGALGPAGATPQVLAALLPLLRETEPNVCSAAARAVGELGPAGATSQVLDVLLSLLRDTEPNVRSAAARAVGALGPAGATSQVLDVLLPLLRDTDPNVRTAAASAVGALGPAGATPQGLDALLPLLHDTDPYVRSIAARVVGALGPAGATRQGLDALLPLLRDTDPVVRSAAVGAVRALGPAGATPQLLDALLPLLRDTDPDVRPTAARAVGALGDKAATRENLNALAYLIDEASDRGTPLEDSAYSSLLALVEYYLLS